MDEEKDGHLNLGGTSLTTVASQSASDSVISHRNQSPNLEQIEYDDVPIANWNCKFCKFQNGKVSPHCQYCRNKRDSHTNSRDNRIGDKQSPEDPSKFMMNHSQNLDFAISILKGLGAKGILFYYMMAFF